MAYNNIDVSCLKIYNSINVKYVRLITDGVNGICQ